MRGCVLERIPRSNGMHDGQLQLFCFDGKEMLDCGMTFLFKQVAVMQKHWTLMMTGNSIECYICQSESDEECSAATPDAKYLRNCSSLKEGPKYSACRKIENYVDFVVLGQKPTKRIIRQCAADVDKDRPCYYRAGFGGRANVCDCFESKCNFASTITNSVLVTLASAIAAALFL